MASRSSTPDRISKPLSHDDIKQLFCTAVNIVEPAHPYLDNPYPVDPSELRYGYKKATSSKYASCGPRSSRFTPVSFSADKHSFNERSMARVLAMITHELTHITVGSHSDEEHGGHPPRFWREFGFYAHCLLDEWDAVQDAFGPLSKRDFIGHIVADEVNPSNIDRRYGGVDMRRHEMARWFESTLKNEP